MHWMYESVRYRIHDYVIYCQKKFDEHWGLQEQCVPAAILQAFNILQFGSV